MNTVLLIVFAYLMGSIPTGYWLVKGLKGIDLLQVGSGSTGTTNVLRTAGKGPAAVVFFVDIFKGFLPVLLAIKALEYNMVPELTNLSPEGAQWLPFVVAIIALVGHSKSIFLNFKGGKSAATSLGVVIAMNWLAALCSFAFFVFIILVTRFVSLASMLAVSTSCFVMYYFSPDKLPYSAFCAIGGVYVVLRHRENIKRLMAGTEPRIGQKVDKVEKGEPDGKTQ
jgi:glycerol-3-phosphate acyltransferase PlsY